MAELDQVVSSNRPIAGVCKGQRTPAIAHLPVAQVPPPAPTQTALNRAHATVLNWGDMSVIREVVVVDPADLEAIRQAASTVGVELVEVPPFRGIEPVMTTVLLVGSPVAVAQVRLEIERLRGGQVFDLRVGAPRPIHRTKALSFGEVRILAADGDVWVARGGGELIAALTRVASGRGEKTVAMVLDTISDHCEPEIEAKEPALSLVR